MQQGLLFLSKIVMISVIDHNKILHAKEDTYEKNYDCWINWRYGA